MITLIHGLPVMYENSLVEVLQFDTSKYLIHFKYPETFIRYKAKMMALGCGDNGMYCQNDFLYLKATGESYTLPDGTVLAPVEDTVPFSSSLLGSFQASKGFDSEVFRGLAGDFSLVC